MSDDTLSSKEPSDYASKVDAAVDLFISLWEENRGDAPDNFVRQFPEPLQPEILKRCQAYLSVLQPELANVQRMGPSALQRLGPFKLIRKLGSGGMATVYLAEKKPGGTRVALKVLHKSTAESPLLLERFRREAVLGRSLSHANIIQVLDHGEADGWHYIAMQYVVGGNLGDILTAQRAGRRLGSAASAGTIPMPVGTAQALAISVGIDIAGALAFAHSLHVLHRDIKPSNILLDQLGKAYLADFGVAHKEEESRLTRQGQLIGTPHYMSPEQALAQRVQIDQRTDIYSLGVVFYEILTLRVPFDGDTAEQILYQIAFRTPETLRKRNPEVDADLERVCLKSMERRPEDRYQSANELLEDLHRLARKERPLGRRPTITRRLRRQVVSRRRAIGILGAIGLAGSGAAYWSVNRAVRQGRKDWPNLRVRTDEEHSGASLIAYRIDPLTDQVRHAKEDGIYLGQAPVEVQLEPGYYRILVRVSASNFAESFAYLPKPGEGLSLFLRVLDTSAVAPGMALIPAGSVIRKTAVSKTVQGLAETAELHVPPFLIDRHAVSNREYRAYLAAATALGLSVETPSLWPKDAAEPAPNDRFWTLPVTSLSWHAARAYCDWCGKRLPTIAEWRLATSGPATGTPYPWGSDSTPLTRYANLGQTVPHVPNESEKLHFYSQHCLPTDEPMPGLSTAEAVAADGPQGLRHTLGNVWEMTASRLLLRDEKGLDTWSDFFLLRGHSWLSLPRGHALASINLIDGESSLDPHSDAVDIGFRCVRSVGPT